MWVSGTPMEYCLDGVDKFHDGVAFRFGEFAEFFDRPAGIAARAAVPHDGFDDIAGAAVVETVAVAATNGRETATPEGSGAAPTGTDVVDHLEAVLNHVGVGPDLLEGVAREAVVGSGEETVGVGEVVGTGGPAWAVAGGAA